MLTKCPASQWVDSTTWEVSWISSALWTCFWHLLWAQPSECFLLLWASHRQLVLLMGEKDISVASLPPKVLPVGVSWYHMPLGLSPDWSYQAQLQKPEGHGTLQVLPALPVASQYTKATHLLFQSPLWQAYLFSTSWMDENTCFLWVSSTWGPRLEHVNWWLSSFTPRRYLAMGGQDTCSYHKEKVYFNPAVYI